MADTQFKRINEQYALAFDRHQWIVQRRGMSKGEESWKALKFVASNTYQLRRALLQVGCPDVDIIRAIADMPPTFTEFLAARNAPEPPTDESLHVLDNRVSE